MLTIFDRFRKYVFVAREKELQKKLDEERAAWMTERAKLVQVHNDEKDRMAAKLEKERETLMAEKEALREGFKSEVQTLRTKFDTEVEILRGRLDEERKKADNRRDNWDEERKEYKKEERGLLIRVMEDHRGREREASAREVAAWARESQLTMELDARKREKRYRNWGASF
jgi:hypothetical protein